MIGRRPDGYHLIESLFWPIDFGDELLICENAELQVQARWQEGAPRNYPDLPQGRENLVYRAAEKALGPESRIHVEVKKRIPMGAGLGGGSSNAGSLLRFLVDKKMIEAGSAEKVALAIGADVPFFLTNQPAWVEGIGEKRTPLTVDPEVLNSLTFVMVVPPEATPTPIIFSRYRSLGMPFAPSLKFPTDDVLDWARLKAYLAQAENSLQGIAAVEYPLVADILATLKKTQPLYSGLSGTGSTCYAVFRTPAQASKIIQDIEPFCRKKGCSSFIAMTNRF